MNRSGLASTPTLEITVPLYGRATRSSSYLADPEYDLTMIIFNGQDGGSYYGYGPDRPTKK